MKTTLTQERKGATRTHMRVVEIRISRMFRVILFIIKLPSFGRRLFYCITKDLVERIQGGLPYLAVGISHCGFLEGV